MVLQTVLMTMHEIESPESVSKIEKHDSVNT